MVMALDRGCPILTSANLSGKVAGQVVLFGELILPACPVPASTGVFDPPPVVNSRNHQHVEVTVRYHRVAGLDLFKHGRNDGSGICG